MHTSSQRPARRQTRVPGGVASDLGGTLTSRWSRMAAFQYIYLFFNKLYPVSLDRRRFGRLHHCCLTEQ